MATSLEIRNRIKTLRDEQAAREADLASPDSAVSDSARDAINRIAGRLEALEDQLDAALADEAALAAVSEPILMGDPQPPRAPSAYDAFRGLTLDGPKVGIRAADLVTLTDPERQDLSLPVMDLPIGGFVGTLLQATTNEDVKYYEATSFTNNADTWAGVGNQGTNTKAESAISWTPRTAPLETVAHWVPVDKMSARRYGQLDSVIRGELLIGLRQKQAEKALVGSAQGGITGILNNANIISYTAAQNDTVADSVRKMITQVVLQTGLFPNRLAVSPIVAQSLDLLKDTQKRYLQLVVNGRLWGLPIVEDVNLTVTETTGTGNDAVTTVSEGALVYDDGAATWFTADTASVEVGLIDKQFVQNSYTLLAECTNALKVPYPKAFSYLKAAV